MDQFCNDYITSKISRTKVLIYFKNNLCHRYMLVCCKLPKVDMKKSETFSFLMDYIWKFTF